MDGDFDTAIEARGFPESTLYEGLIMPQAHVERHEHPLLRRNYRVATAAIESFVDPVERCLRVLMPGALVYARRRMGKTHAIDYVCLHLARVRPEVLTNACPANSTPVNRRVLGAPSPSNALA